MIILNSNNYPFKAKWVSRKLTVDNEQERALLLGKEFNCNEVVNKNRSKREVMPGGYTDNIALTLRSNNELCKDIQAEDSVTFKDCTYSVVRVYQQTSMIAFNKYEYYIELSY